MPLYLTFTLMFLCFTSINSSRIVLSLFALSLGAQPSTVGLLFATFYVFPLMLSWPVGMRSDRVGSRWLLVFATMCGTSGMLIPYFVRELPALFAAAAMVGLSFSCYNVLLQNLVGLLSSHLQRARNFGTASMVGAAATFVGPLLGGFAIDHSGHAAACLYVMALPLVALALLAIWGDILPRATATHKRSPARIGETLARAGIIRLLITSSLVQVGQDLYVFYIPIYGYSIGLSPSIIGAVLGSFAMASFVVRFMMPKLILRLGEERLLAYAFYLVAIGSLLVPFLRSPAALAIVSFMFGLGMGCGQPVTTMLMFGFSEEGRSGETLGLRQSVNNALRMIGPSFFGFVASAFGLFPVFWINALMMGTGGWLARRVATRGRT